MSVETVKRYKESSVTSPPLGLVEAICYLRVSTKEQAEMGGEAEGYSIPAQRGACQRKAESMGAVLIDEFVDAGESARSANRPQLQRMLAFISQHPIKYVIVHKLDRLARNRFDDVEINLALQRAGVTLVSCSENIDETPSGALMHGIMSSIAEFYSRNLANEAIKGMTQKAMVGGTPTKAPIGYLNVRKMIDGRDVATVAIDPERAPLVTWAFEAYATGDYTILSLIEEATLRGLTTLPTRKRAAKPLAPSSMHRILRNPYYIGIVQWRGVAYEGSHDPLIDPDTFERVQQVLDAKNTAGERESIHRHYLKGTVFCDNCGSRLGISMSRGHGGLYPYFMCLGRHTRRTSCTQRALRIEYVEARVEKEWQGRRLDPHYAELVKELLKEELARHRASSRRLASQSARRLQALKEEQAKLLRAHYDGAVPLGLLKSEMQRITDESKEQERRLAQVEVQYDNAEYLLVLAVSLLGNLAEAYSGANDQLRRQLNQAFFAGIYFKDEYSGRFEVAEPFRTLMSPNLVVDHAAESSAPETWDERGLPAWLVEHSWWDEVQSRRRQGNGPRNKSCRRTASSLGLGLSSALLAPPTGFEPVLPP